MIWSLLAEVGVADAAARRRLILLIRHACNRGPSKVLRGGEEETQKILYVAQFKFRALQYISLKVFYDLRCSLSTGEHAHFTYSTSPATALKEPQKLMSRQTSSQREKSGVEPRVPYSRSARTMMRSTRRRRSKKPPPICFL